MHIIVRADGSNKIGLGHLFRVATLARELLERSHQVTVVTATHEFAESILPASVEFQALSTPAATGEFVATLANLSHDVVVTDSDRLDARDHRAIARTATTYAPIVDDADTTYTADAIINGNIYAPDLNYEWAGSEPTWLLGTDYLLLRQAFQRFCQRDPPWRSPPERMLVTMGGVDKDNKTPRAVSALATFDLDVTVVVGPGFENESDIHETAAGQSDIEIVVDPDDFPARMFETDLGVCTLGTTVYEMMATRTPMVGVPDNDTPIADALDRRNAAIVVSREPTVEELESAVSELVADAGRRRHLREQYASWVTGQGPSNVADALEILGD